MNASTSHCPTACVRLLAAATLLAASTLTAAQTPQEHVHGHGHDVMPFDLARTVHVFRMTDDGGIQKVVVRGESPQPQQVAMIQHHLALEAVHRWFGAQLSEHGADARAE